MVCFDNIDFGVFCPNLDDEAKLVLNFETLVTRMLVEHIPSIQHLFPHVTHHIQHKHSRNMSQKSTVTTSTQSYDTCAEDGGTRTVDVTTNHFSHILLGGDQLTVARVRGSQGALLNSDSSIERVEGFVPVIEDWHTKICYMKLLPPLTIVKTLCSEMATISFAAKRSHSSADYVQEYAKEALSLGLLLLEFKDAVREGHKNYCLEAFNFLMQYHYTLTPRCAEQMLWGRFISSESGPGGNISADLHMEHLNRILKETVNHLGANKTPSAIVRAAKALGPLKEIVAEFDKITGIWTHASTVEDLRQKIS
ncbi:hypothetical protein EMCRGX_G014138 [Ephydatia muelleri]